MEKERGQWKHIINLDEKTVKTPFGGGIENYTQLKFIVYPESVIVEIKLDNGNYTGVHLKDVILVNIAKPEPEVLRKMLQDATVGNHVYKDVLEDIIYRIYSPFIKDKDIIIEVK